MSHQEHSWRFIVGIAGVFALRVFGFMAVLPVIALHGAEFYDASPLSIGLAIGIYGFMQALCQFPFGAWSDKLGRKKVVLFGLLLMGVGSIVAATTHSMEAVVLGRAIQGAGAIGSTLNAWCADLTSVHQRTKAMALIGMTIGATFMVAMVLGPVVVRLSSLQGLFWLTALSALLAMFVVQFGLPNNAPIAQRSKRSLIASLKSVVPNLDLMKTNLGIAVLHTVFTACFVVLPSMLQVILGPKMPMWHFYLPVVLGATLMSLPAIFIAEAKGKKRQIFIFAIVLLLMAQLGWLLTDHRKEFVIAAVALFFVAFTTLESLLPSLASKYAKVSDRGSVMGVFSCAQYLGIFCGGSVAGILSHHLGNPSVFIFCTVLILIWLGCAWVQRMPQVVIEKSYPLHQISEKTLDQLKDKLLALSGVNEVKWLENDAKIYLKVDKSLFKEDACLTLLNLR